MEPATLIKEARRVAGLTQAELARRTGVKQPEIARLESGRANPRFATLSRVVAATGHRLVLEVERATGIDESLIAANLRISPSERLRQFDAAYRSTAELVSAAR
jgi:predicted transcriptional regulator